MIKPSIDIELLDRKLYEIVSKRTPVFRRGKKAN